MQPSTQRQPNGDRPDVIFTIDEDADPTAEAILNLGSLLEEDAGGNRVKISKLVAELQAYATTEDADGNAIIRALSDSRISELGIDTDIVV